MICFICFAPVNSRLVIHRPLTWASIFSGILFLHSTKLNKWRRFLIVPSFLKQGTKRESNALLIFYFIYLYCILVHKQTHFIHVTNVSINPKIQSDNHWAKLIPKKMIKLSAPNSSVWEHHKIMAKGIYFLYMDF